MKVFLMRMFFFVFLFTCCSEVFCQMPLPYTMPVYSIRKDSAISYGVDVNFCNTSDTLKMNIYKPINDNNTDRPVIILVHGGGFVSYADFNSPDMDQMAREFAKRGYVAASIDYREGMHLKAYGNAIPGLTVPLGISNATENYAQWSAAFASDSAEVIRAVYRAQQDIKAAVRFMKSNHYEDSTNICSIFLGGHSAGAIAILTAAFLDNPIERPIVTNNFTPVANPNWTSDFWQTVFNNGPENQDDIVYSKHNQVGFNYEAAYCYDRPNLGSVNGTINIASGYDASILGIAALAGGVLDTSILNGNNHPALFLYHIESDVVVPFNIEKPFDYANILFVTPPNNQWPLITGSNRINEKLNSLGYPSPKTFWVYNGPDVNVATTHSILPGISIVSDSIAKFFASVLVNNTNCTILLPVAELNLKGKLLNCALMLSWNKTDATAIHHFEICSSKNGLQFETIGIMQPYNNSTIYHFVVPPQKDITFYRIKIIHKNGNVTLSEVLHLLNDCESRMQVLVYPNPAINKIYIRNIEVNSSISLMDITGKILIKQIANKNNVEINVKELASAFYFIQVISADKKIQTFKIRKY